MYERANQADCMMERAKTPQISTPNFYPKTISMVPHLLIIRLYNDQFQFLTHLISHKALLNNISALKVFSNITPWIKTSQLLQAPSLLILSEISPLTELCSSPEVDVIVIANADAYHVEHDLLALQNDKYCIIEKPLARSFRDIDRLIEAEKTSKGKIMVGTMRRFATAFTDAVAEVGDMSKIMYARVRDIIGPNFNFVNQSGAYPQKFNDYEESDTEDRVKREAEMFQHALCTEFGVAETPQSTFLLRALGGLGTHDLSAIREILGMPQGVCGSHVGFSGWPGIFNVLFKYDGFAGLPNVMTIKELQPGGGFQERTIRKTYMDNYTLEYLDFHDCVVNNKTPKTSAADARQDIELFQMIIQSACPK
ncbi:Inositol 2-dehydrogenase/D-chiro-inositol 3-dehydrogenase [Penicillium malachiteum]|uniref:Inositol 2-dehydrogenase/D-chiro-inositol 3-dehydrogenase n=1 Tax=Penicillium malachiteum TaxID=1324776 RepID=A0AAD6HIZ1_9EURO|nr:Inositol 2-dehydrogenase/D-chiro-inositol 3-dehydrogenase [Penicillium malachiteum]